MTIYLTHLDLGRLTVSLDEDATWRNRRRTWVSVTDPELGQFQDGVFEESPATIDTLLLTARNDQIAHQFEGVGHNADRLQALA
jgi:hypothetical protein